MLRFSKTSQILCGRLAPQHLAVVVFRLQREYGVQGGTFAAVLCVDGFAPGLIHSLSRSPACHVQHFIAYASAQMPMRCACFLKTSCYVIRFGLPTALVENDLFMCVPFGQCSHCCVAVSMRQASLQNFLRQFCPTSSLQLIRILYSALIILNFQRFRLA